VSGICPARLALLGLGGAWRNGRGLPCRDIPCERSFRTLLAMRVPKARLAACISPLIFGISEANF